MKVGYVRCSTAEQNEARQLKMMEEQGVEKIFLDKDTMHHFPGLFLWMNKKQAAIFRLPVLLNFLPPGGNAYGSRPVHGILRLKSCRSEYQIPAHVISDTIRWKQHRMSFSGTG